MQKLEATQPNYPKNSPLNLTTYKPHTRPSPQQVKRQKGDQLTLLAKPTPKLTTYKPHTRPPFQQDKRQKIR